MITTPHVVCAIIAVLALVIVLGNVQASWSLVLPSNDNTYLENILKNISLENNCTRADDLVCPRDDVTFWLYTRNNQNGTKLDQYNVKNLLGAPFVQDAPLKFIVHGFTENKDTSVNAALRPRYFEDGEYNIISVDWRALSGVLCYYQAAESIPTVAKCVADVFNVLTTFFNFSSVHMLGHSLGAHISAQASNYICNLTRLTLFDKAYPMFYDDSRRLVNGSAHFTDEYHSNSGLFGRSSPGGNVDVNFNNGVSQPGCGCDIVCSHNRAHEYYAESIGKKNCMMALPCGGWKDYIAGKCPKPKKQDMLLVGENMELNPKLNRSCLVFTNREEPFCISYLQLISNYTSFKNSSKSDCEYEDAYLGLAKFLIG